MALNRYVLTATVTVGAGTAATPTAGEPGTGVTISQPMRRCAGPAREANRARLCHLGSEETTVG